MERKSIEKKVLVWMTIFAAGLVAMFFMGYFASDSKYVLKMGVNKVKNLLYYEATIHNPEGDVIPDGIDDSIKGKIKAVINN